MARAQIALRLGKRYVQDAELDWGAAVADTGDVRETTAHAVDGSGDNGLHKSAGNTLQAGKKRKKTKT